MKNLLNRNYFVYKEGDPWNWTYVVIDGEFEATKLTPMVNEEEVEDCIIKDYIKYDKNTNKLNKQKLKEIQHSRIRRKWDLISENFEQSLCPPTTNSASFWGSMNHKQK